MRKLLAVCVFLMAALCASAQTRAENITLKGTKETGLRAEDKGILGAMKRMGCNASWLSVSMRLSYIFEGELLSLKEGTPIVVPEGCQVLSPWSWEVKKSQRILSRENELKKTRERSDSYASLFWQMKKEKASQVEAANRTNAELMQQNQALTARAENAEELAEKNHWWVKVLTCVIVSTSSALVLAVVLLSFRLHREIKEGTETLGLEKPVFSVEYKNETIHFENATIPEQPFARCPRPGCSESRLKPRAENLMQHLRKHDLAAIPRHDTSLVS